jgi:methylenetetrahydrofolate dehydrogenase (NADP+)/methenyltetrahydrofolate cyclohydrolase
MGARIINGKVIAAGVRERVTERVRQLKKAGVVPGLAAVLVGDDPASRIYVTGKQKDAHSVGIESFVHALPADLRQEDLLALIDDLNADPRVHGILVQLPLPKGLDDDAAVSAVVPAKDVDGLHPENRGLLTLGRPRFVPCTPLGVQVLLEREGVETEGAHVVIVGRSQLVGRPLSILLSSKGRTANATVTLCHTGTRNLAEHTSRADVVVVAAGQPKTITGDMIRPGAVVIDVGINRGESGLVGDVDFESVSAVAAAITPVPGGVGPMTRAMLLENVVRAATMATS